ncbi:MAG: FAD-dependent oxidoreductase [Planctomycetota bacterium]|nr:FAD-dependent oxidoreductase [Planctomycetota bacterium]
MPEPPIPAPAPDASGMCDVLIIGAGIAGLSAAIYSVRERLCTRVLERQIPGGQILTTARVENYPGFPEPIGGMELSDRLTEQAARFGADIVTQAQVTRIAPHPADGCVDAYVGDQRHRGRTMILAVGSEYRRLEVPGEKRLTGYGVSYCGTCDAPFYRGKHVVVVGGGNTGVDEGLHLLKFAGRLTYVVLGDRFAGAQIGIDELARHGDRVATHFASEVTEIRGEKKVEAVRVRSNRTNVEQVVPCDGVFVFIGMTPLTHFLRGVVDLDEQGFIRTHACTLQTSVPGIWAAGDVRSGGLKQAATAAGDGVVAALNIKEHLKRPRP